MTRALLAAKIAEGFRGSGAAVHRGARSLASAAQLGGGALEQRGVAFAF